MPWIHFFLIHIQNKPKTQVGADLRNKSKRVFINQWVLLQWLRPHFRTVNGAVVVVVAVRSELPIYHILKATASSQLSELQSCDRPP